VGATRGVVRRGVARGCGRRQRAAPRENLSYQAVGATQLPLLRRAALRARAAQHREQVARAVRRLARAARGGRGGKT